MADFFVLAAKRLSLMNEESDHTDQTLMTDSREIFLIEAAFLNHSFQTKLFSRTHGQIIIRPYHGMQS